MHCFVNSNDIDPAIFLKVEAQMLKEVFQNSDETILQLAWLHGLKTRWVFGRQVRRWNDPTEFHDEMRDILLKVLAGVMPDEGLSTIIHP